MLHYMHTDGRLGSIQQTGADPQPFKASAIHMCGMGAFLPAASEIWKMY